MTIRVQTYGTPRMAAIKPERFAGWFSTQQTPPPPEPEETDTLDLQSAKTTDNDTTEDEAEAFEAQEKKAMESAFNRFAAALLILATSFLLHTLYQKRKHDFQLPPKINATQTQTETKAP